MKETILKCYFDGKVPPLALGSALEDIKGKQALPTYSNFELDLENGYTVAIKDLVKICDDVLNGHLDEADVRIIAFLLIASDHFCWSTDAFPGTVISEVLYDWYVPEINYPITRENVEIIKNALLAHKYDPHLLKANSRRFAG